MMADGNYIDSAPLSTLWLIATRPIPCHRCQQIEIKTYSMASINMVADGSKSMSIASVKIVANEKKTNSKVAETRLTP